MTPKILLLAALLLPNAFAGEGQEFASPQRDPVQVREIVGAYVKDVQIDAQDVEGIKVSLATDVVSKDCNSQSVEVLWALVRGDGQGSGDVYEAQISFSTTLMWCPRDKEVKIRAVSDDELFKSNDGTISIRLQVPKDVDLTVVAVPRKQERAERDPSNVDK